MDLVYILRRAWQITWRHKALWLFGLLISLGAGTRLGFNRGHWERVVGELPPEAQRIVTDFLEGPYFGVAVVALVLLGLIVGLALTLFNALGRAGLVDQVRAAEDYGVVDLRAGWQAGGGHLWPVFLIRLLLGLPVVVATLAGALPVVGAFFLIAGQERPEVVVPGFLATPLLILTCLVPAVCLATLLSAPLGVLQRLAIRACVLEEYGVRESISRAWEILREHLGALVLVWLALLGIGIGVILAIGLPLVFVVTPLMTIVLLTVFLSPLLFAALTLAIGVLTWLTGAAVASVTETFFSAVWTLAYRETIGLGLTGEGTVQIA